MTMIKPADKKLGRKYSYRADTDLDAKLDDAVETLKLFGVTKSKSYIVRLCIQYGVRNIALLYSEKLVEGRNAG